LLNENSELINDECRFFILENSDSVDILVVLRDTNHVADYRIHGTNKKRRKMSFIKKLYYTVKENGFFNR